MSEFTVLSKAAYEAISRDDLEAFVALAAPDVQFNSLIEDRLYRGHDGIREWWGNVIKNLGGVGLELEEVHDFDDHGYVKMGVDAGGSEVDLPPAIWQAIRIEDDKAVWWGVFPSEDEARKALGVGKKKEKG
jgi:ketosteroid isomerase-like protein